METKHTPTPWKLYRLGEDSEYPGDLILTANDHADEICGPFLISEEDAEFTLTACNSHSALVDALRDIYQMVTRQQAEPKNGDAEVLADIATRIEELEATAALKLAGEE